MHLPRINDRSQLVIVATPTKLCSSMHAATISFAELHVRLLFKGGYYWGYGFYWNKIQYVICVCVCVQAE